MSKDWRKYAEMFTAKNQRKLQESFRASTAHNISLNLKTRKSSHHHRQNDNMFGVKREIPISEIEPNPDFVAWKRKLTKKVLQQRRKIREHDSMAVIHKQELINNKINQYKDEVRQKRLAVEREKRNREQLKKLQKAIEERNITIRINPTPVHNDFVSLPDSKILRRLSMKLQIDDENLNKFIQMQASMSKRLSIPGFMNFKKPEKSDKSSSDSDSLKTDSSKIESSFKGEKSLKPWDNLPKPDLHVRRKINLAIDGFKRNTHFDGKGGMTPLLNRDILSSSLLGAHKRSVTTGHHRRGNSIPTFTESYDPIKHRALFIEKSIERCLRQGKMLNESEIGLRTTPYNEYLNITPNYKLSQFSQNNIGSSVPQSLKHGSSFITEYITDNLSSKPLKDSQSDVRKTRRREYSSLTMEEVNAMNPAAFRQFVNDITDEKSKYKHFKKQKAWC